MNSLNKKIYSEFVKQSHKGAGFTVLEMIVVLSIVIILTAILVVYTRDSEKQIIFFKEQSVLVAALLRAKSFAIETFQPTQQPGLGLPTEKVCGWGVYFNKQDQNYIVFRDLAPATDCTEADSHYTSTQNEEFETFSFNQSIGFDCFYSSASSCDSSVDDEVSAVFIPPEPKVAFYPDSTASDLIIVLSLKDGSRESTIRINKAGQISY